MSVWRVVKLNESVTSATYDLFGCRTAINGAGPSPLHPAHPTGQAYLFGSQRPRQNRPPLVPAGTSIDAQNDPITNVTCTVHGQKLTKIRLDPVEDCP